MNAKNAPQSLVPFFAHAAARRGLSVKSGVQAGALEEQSKRLEQRDK